MNDDFEALANRMSRAAREVLLEFVARVSELEKQISDTALSILIWGPGEQASDNVLHRKRCQIRDKLRDLGNAAIFSEEIAKIAKGETLPALSELAQAISADFIVVLMTSWGALSEVAKYGYDAEIGSKMLVLAPEQIKEGFAEHAILSELHQNVIYFSQEELDRCELVTKISDLLPRLKCAKFMYYRQKRRWEAG